MREKGKMGRSMKGEGKAFGRVQEERGALKKRSNVWLWSSKRCGKGDTLLLFGRREKTHSRVTGSVTLRLRGISLLLG